MAKSRNIYMDYAASVSSNPSSIHVLGVEAKMKLQNARAEVANILRSRPEEIIFTSGGTESNNLAIQGTINGVTEKSFFKSSDPRVPLPARPFKNLSPLPHIITTNIEHPSVLKTFKMLQKRKLAKISIVPVEKNGIVDPKKIKKEIKKNTVLVSVMYANNEIGTIQPIKEIAKEIRYFKKHSEKQKSFFRSSDPRVPLPARPFKNLSVFPLLHTDAVQAPNYLNLNVEKLGVDLLSLSGSKIEGAGRIGVLYKRKNVVLMPIFWGGDQEIGLRPGTENLPEILKFSKALKLAQQNKEKESKRLIKLRDYFFHKLESQKQNFRAGLAGVGDPGNRGPEKIFVFDFLVNGDLKNRLSNNINITFPKIPSDLLVLELSAKGIMVSSKSACKSSQKEGSYVINAIRSAEARLPQNSGSPASAEEIGGLRFSLGKKTTKADIDYTVKALSQILQKLKKWYD
jgi:cysteine desulfurase